MTIEMPTLSKNKKSFFIPAWLFVCFFIALAAKPNDLKAEERLLYFENEMSVLLYQDADVSSAVLGECLNNIVLEVLDSPIDEWIRVRMGTREENMEGYVAASCIYAVDDPVFNLLNCTNVQSNSRNIAVGAAVYASSGEIKGYIPNGDTALVYVDLPDGRCFVRYWSLEKKQLEFGYVEKTDLTPFDGSAGSYPLDQRIPLDGFTYAFQNLWPDDLYHDLSGFEILRQEPVVGGIAANGGMQAFVVTHDGYALHFYELTRAGNVWEIESINDGLLYQDGYFPESISFSRDAQKMWIQFPEEEYGRIHLLGFAQTAETGQWVMQNAIYAYRGDTTASLIREDDIYYTVYSEIGNSADRQMIDIREEDMLLYSVCIADLEKMLYKLMISSFGE